MKDGFWLGGASELEKAIRKEFEQRINQVQSQKEASTDPAEQAALDIQIHDLKAQCERECDEIDGRIF